MFSYVMMVGRINTKLELKKTKSGYDYCNFSLQIKRGDDIDNINTVLWNDNAKELVLNCKKDDIILVTGTLQTRMIKFKECDNLVFSVQAHDFILVDNTNINPYDYLKGERK